MKLGKHMSTSTSARVRTSVRIYMVHEFHCSSCRFIFCKALNLHPWSITLPFGVAQWCFLHAPLTSNSSLIKLSIRPKCQMMYIGWSYQAHETSLQTTNSPFITHLITHGKQLIHLSVYNFPIQILILSQ